MSALELPQACASDSLSARCPHCGCVLEDEYEALADNKVYTIRCEECQQPFQLLFADCPACQNESVITWPDAQKSDDFRDARCSCCDARLHQYDDDPTDEEVE